MLKYNRVCFVLSLLATSVLGCRAVQNSSSGTKDIITITADGNNLAILYYITTPDGSTPGNAEEIVVRKQCGKLNAEYDVRGLSGNNYPSSSAIIFPFPDHVRTSQAPQPAILKSASRVQSRIAPGSEQKRWTYFAVPSLLALYH